MGELSAIASTLMSVKRRLEDTHNSHQNDFVDFKRQMDIKLDKLHNAVKRIAAQPIARHVPSQESDTAVESNSNQLSKRPSDLYNLWREYEFGLGGSKPARTFTAKERGTCKWAYSFRLNFWSLIETMTRRGHTSDTAIDAVYSAYGRSSSVTQILTQLRKDKTTRQYHRFLN
jgi:hypothetical protein